MTDSELSTLVEKVEATPAILRALMTGITPEQAQWKPAPDRFSIAEVLEHLSHVEAHCFRARVEKMVREQTPDLESYDQEAYKAAGQYSGRDAEDSFDHFEEQREDNVEFLHTLTVGQLQRSAKHAVVGIVTIEQMLNQWAFHDLGHVRQIAELVRTIQYYPGLGPFQGEYKVNP